jgi:amino acid transporter
MRNWGAKLKTLFIGHPLSNRKLKQTELSKRLALPVFASDALSSVAYAPDEILLTLALGGSSALTMGPWVGLAVVAVMFVVVLTYHQNVYAYPSGGGNFEVVNTNLGPNAGLVVGASLSVDYILTVAVSISSGCTYLTSMFPALSSYRTEIAVVAVLFICFMNLRGTRESGSFFTIPAYAFIISEVLLIFAGLFQFWTGQLGAAATSAIDINPDSQFANGLTGLGLILLLSRTFASGNTALTGIEAISNGVPLFKEPKSKNAAQTLLMLGGLSAFMLMSILFLSNQTGIAFLSDPEQLATSTNSPALMSAAQTPVLGQLAQTIFPNFSPVFYVISFVTLLILFLAANTAFNGFPSLTAILARESYLPHYLKNRGTRLGLSNGIIFLGLVSCLLIAIFRANVSALIQLYIVGVFISFTFSNLGMIKHWKTHPEPRVWIKRTINIIGFILTGTVLIIILINKFTHGAWITLLLIACLFLYMKRIRRLYQETETQVTLTPEQIIAQKSDPSLNPTSFKAILLVSELNRPTVRALHYARLTKPDNIIALHVDENPDLTRKLQKDWEAAQFETPLQIIPNPYRETVANIVKYVKITRGANPEQLLAIYVPEFEVTKASDFILHNRTANRLRSQLYDISGVIFVTVTWPLDIKNEAKLRFD